MTHDTDRLVAFYREVFDAETGAHPEEFDGAVQLTFIRIGPTAELNVFQIEGTPKPAGRPRCLAGAGSTTSGCKPPRSTRSTRYGTG